MARDDALVCSRTNSVVGPLVRRPASADEILQIGNPNLLRAHLGTAEGSLQVTKRGHFELVSRFVFCSFFGVLAFLSLKMAVRVRPLPARVGPRLGGGWVGGGPKGPESRAPKVSRRLVKLQTEKGLIRPIRFNLQLRPSSHRLRSA